MLKSTYDYILVFGSLSIAVLASYTALAVVSRISRPSARGHRMLWLAGGAAAMGLGIWSMHFIGMLAFSLSIPLGYDVAITIGSLLVAVLISYLGLDIGTRGRLSWRQIAVSGALMGFGISGMHYAGIAALKMTPSIQYRL